MGLVGVFDLMETGIGIPFNLMSPEEIAVDELSKTARKISIKYHNPYRWTLDQEEIFAELQVETTKALNRYFTTKSYNEFLLLAHAMLWNRMREMLSRVYGTNRNKEYTAHYLSEDALEDNGYYEDAFTVFLLYEFMERLSEPAQRILRNVLDPDERMQDAILNYINVRGKLYKKGAGIYRLPLEVIQAGTDENPRKVKKAYEEIRKELKKERSVMTIGMGINFADKLVSWQDVKLNDKPMNYLRWMKDMLRKQCEFRGIYTEGAGRTEMIKVLREDDKKRGIPSDESLPVLPEGLEYHLPKNGNGIQKELKKETEQVKTKVGVRESDEDEYVEDDEEEEVVKVNESEEEEDVDDGFMSVQELKKRRGRPPLAKKQEEEKKPAIEQPEAKKPVVEKKEEVKTAVNADIVTALMNLLREGETLRIKKVGDNEWLVSLEK